MFKNIPIKTIPKMGTYLKYSLKKEGYYEW